MVGPTNSFLPFLCLNLGRSWLCLNSPPLHFLSPLFLPLLLSPYIPLSGEMIFTFPAEFGAPFPDFDSCWDDLSDLFEPISTLPKSDPVAPIIPTDSSGSNPNPCYPRHGSCENPSPKSGSGSDSDQTANYKSSPEMCLSGSDQAQPRLGGPESDPDQPADFSSILIPEPAGSVSVMEERKRKRKVSNRESAKRTRMRKQKHVENLVGEVNRLEMEKRELANRVELVNHYSDITRRDNERLWGDCVFLRRRWTLITQILHSLHAAHAMTI